MTTGMNISTLIAQYLRTPDGYGADGTPVFTPPLDASEQAKLADLRLMENFGIPATITLAEFQAMKPKLLEARGFRTQSDAAFTALTAAQRDAALRTAIFDVIDVIGALLRS